MSAKDHKDYWSDCGQILFTGGFSWGLTDKLNNICLGSEDNIKKFFETGELNDGLNSIERQVLLDIIEYRKEQG